MKQDSLERVISQSFMLKVWFVLEAYKFPDFYFLYEKYI